MRLKAFVLSATATTMLAIGFFYLAPIKSYAITGSDFQAGRIIDDAIFFNSNAMTPDQIQYFLDSKVPTCDRNHSGITGSSGTRYDPPFTCLKEYIENPTTRENNIGRFNSDGSPYNVPGGMSAAQIIWSAGQAHGINPQVLLVMLQKEQGLVTDTWPTAGNYKIALGFACPDTAPCDSQYYGFYNQVSSAAKQLKKYVTYPDSYNFKAGVTRYIGYNPSSACGGSNVYLQNSATAALYNYTPYQPNPGALASLTDTNPGGTSDCGAYGNRNFWWFFNKWFGSTFGSLFRTVDSGTLYYTNGKYRFIVPSVDLINQYGLSLNDVRFVSQQELDAIPIAPSPFTSTLGQVIKSNSDTDSDGGALYLVSDGRRHQFGSMEQFTAFGYKAQSINVLPIDIISRITPNTLGLSSFVKGSDNYIYKMEGGSRRVIFEFSKFAALNPSGKVTQLSNFTLAHYYFGTALIDGNFVAIGPDKTVRLYTGATSYYTLTSMDQYQCWGLANLRNYTIENNDLLPASNQGTIRCSAKTSSGKFYLAINGVRYELAGGAHSQPPLLNDYFVNSLPSGYLHPVVKGEGPELAVLEGDLKRPIPSMSVFEALGYSSNQISEMPNNSYYALPTGSRKYSIGSLILEPNKTVSVVTGSNSRSYISSEAQFGHYGFNWGAILPADSPDLWQFPNTQTLGQYIRNGNELFLVDSGYSYVIPTTLDTAVGVNRASLPAIDTGKVLSGTRYAQMKKFVKAQDGPTIYLLDGGKKRPYADWNAFMRDSSNKPQDIVNLSPGAIAGFPDGSVVY